MRQNDNAKNNGVRIERTARLWAAIPFLLLAVAASAASSGLSPAARDLEREVVFNLPRQPLENALLGFSEQAKIQVMTASTVIPDQLSGSVVGRQRVRIALDMLLHGTGLRYSVVNDTTVAIHALQAGGDNWNAASEASLRPVTLLAAVTNASPDNAKGSSTGGSERVTAAGQPARSSDLSGIEEVLVTATKRGAASAQSLPISISAISGKSLEDSGSTVFADWSHTVPGLVYQDQGPGDKRYIIRGVQSIGAATVGVYLDNAVITGSNGEDDGGGKNVDLRLYDVNRIEVLRGPQGTLYGASSLSGTIRLITNTPNLDRIEGNVGAQLSDTAHGSDNYNFNGVFNVPIIDGKLGLRAVGWYVNDSGYIDNVRLGNKEINTEETSGGRVTLALAATDRLKMSASFLYQDQELGGKSFYFPADGELQQSEYTLDPRTDRAKISQLDIAYAGDRYDFDLSSAYFDRFVYYRFDSTPILIFFGVPDLPAVTLQPEDSSIFTTEARISSRLDGPVQFVVGALYQKQTRDFISSVVSVDAAGRATADQFSPDIFGRISSRDVDQDAVFGEATYTFNPKWSATAGLRWFRSEERSHSQNTFPFFGGPPEAPRDARTTETKVTPKFSVSYKISDQALIYGLAAQGFRQGGTNSAGFGSLIVVPEGFKADSLWNYELGWKSSWLDRRLILNVTAYAIRWSNIQSKNHTTLGFVYIGNAGTASSDGLEAEFTMRPTTNWELQASVAFQNARLTEDQPLAATDTDAGKSGDRIPNTPRLTFSGSAQYTRPMWANVDGFIRGDISYVGNSQTYFSQRSEFFQELPGYALADFRLGLRADKWTATLFVKNAFDRRAAIDKLFQTDSPLSVFVAKPRTIGIDLGYRF